MDPNATLQMMRDATNDNDPTEAASHATDLLAWLAKGGFTPRAVVTKHACIDECTTTINRALDIEVL